MNGLGVIGWALMAVLTTFAAPKEKKKDLLKLRNGKSLEVVVLNIDKDSVQYRLPDLQKKYTIARTDVKSVEYSNGTNVAMDTKESPTNTNNAEWHDLPITREPKEVEGLISVEKIDVTLSTGSNMVRTKAAELEASAFMQLRQKAYEKGATIILIRSTEFKTAYGEPPAIHIVGESFRSLSKRKKQ